MKLPLKIGTKKNSLKFSKEPAEKYPHAFMKFQICHWLLNNGCDYYTEAEFTSPYSGRADILAYNGRTATIIEVIDSEKKLKQSKVKNYPPYEIIVVDANQQFTPELLQ